jgi:hypothetical protein
MQGRDRAAAPRSAAGRSRTWRPEAASEQAGHHRRQQPGEVQPQVIARVGHERLRSTQQARQACEVAKRHAHVIRDEADEVWDSLVQPWITSHAHECSVLHCQVHVLSDHRLHAVRCGPPRE